MWAQAQAWMRWGLASASALARAQVGIENSLEVAAAVLVLRAGMVAADDPTALHRFGRCARNRGDTTQAETGPSPRQRSRGVAVAAAAVAVAAVVPDGKGAVPDGNQGWVAATNRAAAARSCWVAALGTGSAGSVGIVLAVRSGRARRQGAQPSAELPG